MDLNDAIGQLDQLRRLLSMKRVAADQIEDVCQSTFLRWLRTNRRCPGRLPASYIVRLGLYERLSSVRRSRHSDSSAIANDELPSPPSDTADAVSRHEQAAAIRDAVSSLKPPLREVLCLRYFDGLKLHEIAEHCHESINTVKLRLHRAKRLLRDRLESYRDN